MNFQRPEKMRNAGRTLGIAAAAVALALGSVMRATAQSPSAVRLDVNWERHLGSHDLVWDRMPEDYFEGAFVGNGLFGAIIFKDDQKPNTLRFEIGRADVYDHRTDGTRVGHARIRLPIGQLLLTPVGTVTKTTLRTDLWNGEVRGSLETTAGTLNFRCFAPSGEKVVVLNLQSTAGEARATCTFRPQQGNSQRYAVQPNRDKGFVYVPNPPYQVQTVDGVEVTTQPLLAGSDYATAWSDRTASASTRTVLVTVANRYVTNPDQPLGSAADATKMLRHYEAADFKSIEHAHRQWWHSFYPASFVSIPDPRLESFFWIQLYKLASATRTDGPVIDLMGPWFRPSIWAALWMNLNVQLTYSTLGTTNHSALEDPLYRLLERHRDQLVQNVPPAFQADCAAVANPVGFDEMTAPVFLTEDKASTQAMNLIVLPWLTQEFYEHTRRTMDDARLRESLYPMMRRAFNVYLRILSQGGDGRYHVPYTYSDEYGNAHDTSLNLALVRWGFQTLVDCATRLKIDDPLLPRWREVLAKLADYPTDAATGIMIGQDVPFAKSHRHYSHLFAIWPLRVMDVNPPSTRLLAEQSIRHFTDLEGDNCMFKYTGAASLWATLGNGDQALSWVNRALTLLPRTTRVPTVGPNTLYSENGWPTFESPIAASRNLIDMLMQDANGVISVFPAVPSTWNDASFHDLKAQGAFMVSAVRRDGHTLFVRIKSLAGERCVLRADFSGEIKQAGSRVISLSRKEGLLELGLKAGEEVVLYTGVTSTLFTVSPLAIATGKANAWGAKLEPSK